MSQQTIKANFVAITERKIYPAAIHIAENKIASITQISEDVTGYVMPGFIDAHVHIESSMLTPYEFARIALTHGTVATISDPHEIANVCGMDGINYMLENAKDALLKFHFGAPSCVPATGFETAGATIDENDIETLLKNDAIFYLSEMMNYPGVLLSDAVVMKKIDYALKFQKPIDGHAPGLRGDMAKQYIEAGRGKLTISTDHECFTLEEALDKLQHGMYILIREGSAAKNFNALHSLIASHTGRVMFCMDDAHPDDLINGHINLIAARAIAMGYNLFDVLQCACINPHLHYKTKSGVLQPGQPADFIIVDDLINFKVRATYINGNKVVADGVCNLPDRRHPHINRFNIHEINLQSLQLKTEATQQVKVRVIEALEGQLITNETEAYLMPHNGLLESDVAQDVLKMVVVNRYQNAAVAHAFIKNFNLTTGAIASTVAHDSHNIICVGVTDEAMQKAINAVINHKGALAVYDGENLNILPLPIGGLMSDGNAADTAGIYSKLNEVTKTMGCTMHAPFMTLSFMALLVIPDLKLSDRGLFSGKSFAYTPLVIND